MPEKYKNTSEYILYFINSHDVKDIGINCNK